MIDEDEFQPNIKALKQTKPRHKNGDFILNSITNPKGQSGFGAGEGNRTLVISLEGYGSTIELHPHKGRPKTNLFKKYGGEGWIRTSVPLRDRIYSPTPLTTRPPLHISQSKKR